MKKNQLGIFYCVFVVFFLGVLLAACCNNLMSHEECQEYLNSKAKQFNDEYTEGASIVLEKNADPKYFTAAGEVITYTYSITNNGTKPFNSKEIGSGRLRESNLLSTFKVQDDKVAVSCPAVQNITINKKVTCTGTYTVTEQDLAQGQVVNNASAEVTQTTTFSCLADGGCETDYWIIKDASYAARALTALTVLFDAQPDLLLTKYANPEFHSGDQRVTYTYTLTNTGNVSLIGPFIIEDDRVPTNWSCEERAELLPGDTMLCQGDYFIDAGIRWAITNTATAYAFYGEQWVSSNTASASVLYRQPFLPPSFPMPPYCGDGIVNQDWEECEPPGSIQCDVECQDIP